MDGLDISNNTTRFSVPTVQRWRDDGVGVAIIQLISGVHLAGDDCAHQIWNCLAGGIAVDCYLFPGNDGLPLDTRQRLALVPPDLRSQIRQLWVDIEPTPYSGPPVRSKVDQAHAICDAWAPWQRTGDYSAFYVAQQMGWLPWPWPDRKQWLVHVYNDGHSNLGGEFEGTNNHVMTQYKMDVTVAGVSGMDRSLLSASEEAAVTRWLGGPPVAITVGEGMQNQMSAAGDSPWCGHRFTDETDDDGNTFKVEECYGRQGLYVSSNASGQWESAGPF